MGGSRFYVEWMRGTFICVIVEAPIPNQDPIGNLQDTRISISLRLTFDQIGINSIITYVLVFKG